MRIICVDDHPILLSSLLQSVRLAAPDANIQGFSNAQQALDHAIREGCDVLMCEIELYQHSGIWLAEQIRKHYPSANIIFVTVCSEKEHARDVLRLRASGYLTKPTTQQQIAEELRHLRYSVAALSRNPLCSGSGI